MKRLIVAIVLACASTSVFAAELAVPGIDPSKGIGAGDVRYEADGSMGVGDMKYDANGASAGSGMAVDRDNARAGGLVASGGMNPELTPLNGGTSTGTSGAGVGKPAAHPAGDSALPPLNSAPVTPGAMTKVRTGAQENLIIALSAIIAAAFMYVRRKKHA